MGKNGGEGAVRDLPRGGDPRDGGGVVGGASAGKQQLDEEQVWRYRNERLITIFPKFLPVNKMILRNMV